MRRLILIGVLVVIGVGVLISLWNAPISVLDVLTQPVQSILGSPRQLQTSLLEVSENINPVEEATRRLLQPFGVIRVIRRFPSSASSDTSSSKK